MAVCFDRCWSRLFPWVKSIRQATEEEDAQGKDVIVETTAFGDIPIQVKSSGRFVRKHMSRYPDVPVLVVYRTDTEEQVRKNLARLLKAERAKRDPSYVPRADSVAPSRRQGPPEPLRATLGDLIRRR